MHFYSGTFLAPARKHYSLDTACFSVEVSPLDRATYQSHVEVAELDGLTLALVESRASVVLRKNEEASTPDNRRFSFLYVVRGDLMVSQRQRSTSLRQGEFVLIDNSHPRTMFVYDSVTLLLVCVPHKLLRHYLPRPQDLIAEVLREPLEADRNPIFRPVLALWDHLREGRLDSFARSIGDTLLQDIGRAYAERRQVRRRSPHAERLSHMVKAYIESHLGDPQLSVESIAAHFRISSRYLRSLFPGEERLSQFILRRRLEECAGLLISPLHRSASITEIAYRCGFNSSTHFARCFRAMYGERARDFRRRHLLAQCEGEAAR